MQELIRAIEIKDATTAAHSWRVVLYARALAEARGVDHATIVRITSAAAMHDVGKLDIPDEILQKPGPLTPEEFAVIKKHPVLGYDRLVGMGESDEIMLELVRHHHERLDGLGYPDGLRGSAIGLGPAMFSVIDSFDALTSVRPYRKDVGPRAAERALAELHASSGTQYCGEAVEVFDRLYRTGALDWILEYFNDSCPVPAFSSPVINDKLAHPLVR